MTDLNIRYFVGAALSQWRVHPDGLVQVRVPDDLYWTESTLTLAELEAHPLIHEDVQTEFLGDVLQREVVHVARLLGTASAVRLARSFVHMPTDRAMALVELLEQQERRTREFTRG